MVGIIVVTCCQIARDTDALARVIAEPGATLRVVEAERPRLIEVESDQRVCPAAHPLKIRHIGRLERTYDIQTATDAAAARRSAASTASSVDCS